MRILTVGNMYPPHHQGGYELMWQAAVAALRERGHEVTVLTTDHREPGVTTPDEPGVHRTLDWYWEDHAFRALGPTETFRLERANHKAFAAVGAHDVVQWWAMGGMSLSLIARAARRGTPSLAVVHDGWPAYAPRYDRRQARYGRRLPDRYDPAQIDHWSFNSAYSRDLLGRAGIRVDPSRTSIEYPGVDLTRFTPVAPKHWRWKLAYVGRVEERKGVATALRTLALLPPAATLTIAGAGEPKHVRELEQLAVELGVAERVRWKGAVANPAKVYAKADVVLFCVEWAEPFGLVPLEAMAVGRPVVATGSGGSGEYLGDDENCLIVPPADAQATAAAVLRLAQDPALRERLRVAGNRSAEQHSLAGFCAGVAAQTEHVVASARR